MLLGGLRSALRSRADLGLENLALRQQLASFVRSGRRPRIAPRDRWFWLSLRRFWSRWSDVLVFVKAETVVRWHRATGHASSVIAAQVDRG
jgi:putative transposase